MIAEPNEEAIPESQVEDFSGEENVRTYNKHMLMLMQKQVDLLEQIRNQLNILGDPR